jgi:DNA-binding NarL/FixJ family response regulator
VIRVLVCDDHQIVRQGIRQILADAPDIAPPSEAATGPEALQKVRDGGIDVVLLDIALPLRDGLDVLKQLRAEQPRLPVLMLSTYPDRQYAVRSMKLGAVGYLNKSADSEQLIDAVRRAAAGGLFVTPAVAELLAGALQQPGPGADEVPLERLLSHREHQVFQLLSQGRSVSEIAEQLALAPNTVSTYRARILDKTGARNDVELALLAVRERAREAVPPAV